MELIWSGPQVFSDTIKQYNFILMLADMQASANNIWHRITR